MDFREKCQVIWNWPSLGNFTRPSHATWPDVIRGAGITTLLGWIALNMEAPRALLPLTLGSVFTAIAETGQGQEHPWRTMVWTTSWLSIAAGLGAVVGEYTPLAVVGSGVMGFVCGTAASHGSRTAVTSLLTLVVFTIYCGWPGSIIPATQDMALIFTGGMIQTVGCLAVRAFQKKSYERVEHPQLWISLKQYNFQPIKEHLRHGMRLGVTLMVATSISETTGLPHQYWLPMTVAWVSRAQLSSTCNRIIHRLLGTVLGLFVVQLVVQFIGPQGSEWLPLSLIGAGILVAYVWVHYAIAVMGVTMWIVSAFALVGDRVVDTIANRMLDTFVACLIVLVAVLIDKGFKRTK